MRVVLTEEGLIEHRLALWASWGHATGRSLGKRLRSLRWADAARRGRTGAIDLERLHAADGTVDPGYVAEWVRDSNERLSALGARDRT